MLNAYMVGGLPACHAVIGPCRYVAADLRIWMARFMGSILAAAVQRSDWKSKQIGRYRLSSSWSTFSNATVQSTGDTQHGALCRYQPSELDRVTTAMPTNMWSAVRLGRKPWLATVSGHIVNGRALQ